ncbi:hypothetical protein [Candidatus Chloroploca sp. Khr17]|uniref:hypothetical protein n=1 Tax=Candidatus Chloroploca sp. Khr17 TaxID=2496869 RepID=UPI00101CD22B|nr:hypothetical protein [Candidatus Chloroploca sp. Khr17]
MIIQLRPSPHVPHHAHRRRCYFAPETLHLYRRVLVRRIGITPGARPASILDTLARALLDARVA